MSNQRHVQMQSMNMNDSNNTSTYQPSAHYQQQQQSSTSYNHMMDQNMHSHIRINNVNNGEPDHEHVESPEEMENGVYEMSDTKRSKREPGGKKIRSCIYCRRSHMVCDTERPCRRCVKRGITHLCLEDSKLAAKQLAAQAVRAAQKRASGGGSGSDPVAGETSSDAAGPGGIAGHKRRRTSSTGTGFPQMSQSQSQSRPQQVIGRDREERTDQVGSSSSSSAAVWGNIQGFQDHQTGGQAMQGQEPVASTSNWAFAPPDISRTDNSGNSNVNANVMGEPSRISGSSDIPNMWPGNEAMGMSMLNAASSSSNAPFAMNRDVYALGSSSSSSTMQRPEDNVSTIAGTSNHNNNLSSRQDSNKYLNVALNNVPRRASAERGGEFGILSEYLESLGIPSLPGGLGDVLTETAQTQTLNPQVLSEPGPSRTNSTAMGNNALGSAGAGNDHDQVGNGLIGLDALDDYGIDWNALGMGLFNVETDVNTKRFESAQTQEDVKPLIPEASNTEKFYLAAADQQSGTRDERLKKVIQAKYEAGLLKPYDYARGYARMYKWLEKNVSQASIQAILRPMSVFRPAFRAIAQSLSDLDLIFVEEAFERLMLDYDRVFSAIHTPACLWRRTGEIYKGNKEMSNLTGIPSQCFRGGNLGIFQLMDEESVVKYYQLFGSIAFDTNTKSVNTVCTLQIPSHLTRTPRGDNTVAHTTATTSPALGPAPTHPFNNSTFNSPTSSPSNALGGSGTHLKPQNPSSIPTLSLGQSMTGIEQAQEAKVIKCALNFTIRRDSWGMPIAIIGNWIPV